MTKYNEKLSMEAQIEAEEDISYIIFNSCGVLRLSEDECASLGRDILKQVLLSFRKDLFED